MDVRMFTVGMVQENCYLLRRDGSDRALIVDPGDEAPKLLGAIEALGVELDGILLTHTHFDHVGAVAPIAKATGAEVWVPEVEKAVFAGDVLFQGSVGRTDLPGGDWPTLLESIRSLIDSLPEETTVYPGHMGITSLGAERATNPFLAELTR